jgi:hypothetical protein
MPQTFKVSERTTLKVSCKLQDLQGFGTDNLEGLVAASGKTPTPPIQNSLHLPSSTRF